MILPFKNKKWKVVFISVYLSAIFTVAAMIRFYHLSFFEFKYDQLNAILLGNQVRQAQFLITHGMNSGAQFNNPPLFIYLMGILTYFTNNPYFITAFFTLLNLVALFIAIMYFCSFMPVRYAILSSTLLAFAPAVTIYSSNIWGQCSLPVILVLFNIIFCFFVKNEQPGYFVVLSLLAGISAQIHMSGFFLFPALVILGVKYRNIIKGKHYFLAIALLFIIFLPYLYHLLVDGELYRVIAHAKGDNDIPWNIFRSHIWFNSIDFFRACFRSDLLNIIRYSLGGWGLIFYLASFIIPALFIVGIVEYFKFLIKGRRIFNKESLSCPLPFQVSSFLILVITLGYLVFRVRTPLHYLIICFPAHAVIAAFGAWKLWKYLVVRIALVTAVIFTLFLTVILLRFLDNAGGYPFGYGPSYKMLNKIGHELGLLSQEKGKCVDLRLRVPKEGKHDEGAMKFIIAGDFSCKSGEGTLPVDLDIDWDKKTM